MPRLSSLMLGYYFGGNKLGSEGVLHLSKGKWKKLKIIDLSIAFINIDYTGINPVGAGWLIRGNWVKMTTIYIGNF
jgi:hypothetical protein